MRNLVVVFLALAGCEGPFDGLSPVAQSTRDGNVVVTQSHAFYRGTDNQIYHLTAHLFGGPYVESWTALAGAPAAAGKPATLVTTNPNQLHVFYRTTASTIHHIWLDTAYHHDDWTLTAGAGAAAGDPQTLLVGTAQHVFYRSTLGNIEHIVWDGGFTHENWTTLSGAPTSAGNPAPTWWLGFMHVFYRGANNHIFRIWFDGSAWHHDDWTTATGAPTAVGDPAALSTGLVKHVFFRGSDAFIRHITEWQGQLARADWTAQSGAAGDPTLTTVWTSSGALETHVFYRGTDSSIQHVFTTTADGSVHHDNWTASAGGPASAGKAAVGFTDPGNQTVDYRDGQGNIERIWWDGTTFHLTNWTTLTQAHAAASDPADALTQTP